MRAGRTLLVVSILTRTSVVALLCILALLPRYHNNKIAYNNPRLVELASGKTARVFYEQTDRFFSLFGNPAEEARKHAGMTWSIRIAGVPFTDPIAALSVAAKSRHLEIGFILGLIIPLTLALLFGRVFCAYICPASLLFFAISRVRSLLLKFFYLPELSLNRGFSWGLLAGGLAAAVWIGHGIWTLILPYLSMGQTLYHGIAFGTLSIALGSIVLFSLLDLVFGKQFTCRYVCPTGRLLGFIGRKSVFALKRDAANCLDGCQSCIDVCPMKIRPRFDETVDCSMCGECLTICPTKCLSIGRRLKATPTSPSTSASSPSP
jgi:ferredoxin-type protein NapH